MSTLAHEINQIEYDLEDPFPHTVIDNYWDSEELTQAVDELVAMPDTVWCQNLDPTSNDCAVQRKKMALNTPDLLDGHAPTMQKVMRAMNSPPMIESAWRSRSHASLSPAYRP